MDDSPRLAFPFENMTAAAWTKIMGRIYTVKKQRSYRYIGLSASFYGENSPVLPLPPLLRMQAALSFSVCPVWSYFRAVKRLGFARRRSY